MRQIRNNWIDYADCGYLFANTILGKSENIQYNVYDSYCQPTFISPILQCFRLCVGRFQFPTLPSIYSKCLSGHFPTELDWIKLDSTGSPYLPLTLAEIKNNVKSNMKMLKTVHKRNTTLQNAETAKSLMKFSLKRFYTRSCRRDIDQCGWTCCYELGHRQTTFIMTEMYTQQKDSRRQVVAKTFSGWSIFTDAMCEMVEIFNRLFYFLIFVFTGCIPIFLENYGNRGITTTKQQNICMHHFLVV